MSLYRFTVEGRLQFPLDMLRYDACYPSDSEDVHAIHATMDVKSRIEQSSRGVPFRITLVTRYPGPTKERWSSFGWRVVS